MRNRRRSKNLRGRSRKKTGVSYMPVVVILCLSIGCGYATAKYVVEPVVNYAPQYAEKVSDKQDKTGEIKKDGTKASERKSEAEKSKKKVVEDQVNVGNSGKIKGYALQFGSYSTESAAEKAMSSLEVTGLQIIENNSMYKVIGKIYSSKEQARTELAGLPDGTKAFAAAIYE